jgi:hypothetical protein
MAELVTGVTAASVPAAGVVSPESQPAKRARVF